METLLYHREGHIGHLTLNRPQRRNSFDLILLQELESLLTDLEQEKALRVLILRGSGDKAFSTGVDLNAVARFESVEAGRSFALQLERTMLALLKFPKPVIAIINGFALGGGYGLASSTDYKIMADTAQIGFPAVRIGAILPIACTLRLNALAGLGVSRDLLLSGRMISAGEAKSLGLVEQVVPFEALDTTGLAIAEEMLKGADEALSMSKQMINATLIRDIENFSLTAADNFAYLSQTREWKSRMAAFLIRGK